MEEVVCAYVECVQNWRCVTPSISSAAMHVEEVVRPYVCICGVKEARIVQAWHIDGASRPWHMNCRRVII